MKLDLEQYTYELRYSRTLNEFINDLVQGHAGAILPCDLEKHFMELVQDEVFFQFEKRTYNNKKTLKAIKPSMSFLF